MADPFKCWKCGAVIDDEPMPLGREARCRACVADLHVCRLCCFYDTGKAKSCAEPVADEVRDKERANFCGYFSINADAHDADAQAEAARQRLQAMFGLADGAAAGSGSTPDPDALLERRRAQADAARARLGKLFGLDE
jgi:hypothetical protein